MIPGTLVLHSHYWDGLLGLDLTLTHTRDELLKGAEWINIAGYTRHRQSNIRGLYIFASSSSISSTSTCFSRRVLSRMSLGTKGTICVFAYVEPRSPKYRLLSKLQHQVARRMLPIKSRYLRIRDASSMSPCRSRMEQYSWKHCRYCAARSLSRSMSAPMASSRLSLPSRIVIVTILKYTSPDACSRLYESKSC